MSTHVDGPEKRKEKRSVTFSIPRPRWGGVVMGLVVVWLYVTMGAEAAPEWFWWLAVVVLMLSLVA